MLHIFGQVLSYLLKFKLVSLWFWCLTFEMYTVLDVIGAPMFAMARFPVIYQNTNSLGVMNLRRISVNEFSEVRRRSAPNLIDETVLDEIAVDDELVLMMDISDVEYFDPMTRPIGKNSPTQWEIEGSGLTDDPNFMEINYVKHPTLFYIPFCFHCWLSFKI